MSTNKDLSQAVLVIAALLSDKRIKDRFDGMLKVSRELEFYLNLPSKECQQIEAFWKARAKVKDIMEQSIEAAMDYPSLPQNEETPDVA